ncbi:MAG TPA: hypothetical protein QGF58_20870 [Myxococcota bacterium]|nr:hypothetical protein [Myxococcota bacterium]
MGRPKTEGVRVTLRLDQASYDFLQYEAERHGLDLSGMLRYTLRQHYGLDGGVACEQQHRELDRLQDRVDAARVHARTGFRLMSDGEPPEALRDREEAISSMGAGLMSEVYLCWWYLTGRQA